MVAGAGTEPGETQLAAVSPAGLEGDEKPMIDVKLAPCPFCKGNVEIERFGDARQSTVYSCIECGCRLETPEEWGYGARWNARAIIADESRKNMYEALMSAKVILERSRQISTNDNGHFRHVTTASALAEVRAAIAKEESTYA